MPVGDARSSVSKQGVRDTLLSVRFMRVIAVLAFFVLASFLQIAVAVSPLWRLDVRRNEPVTGTLGPQVVNDGARVFYLQAGQVRALEAATGRPVWTFWVGGGAQLRYGSGRVLAITARGKVYALEPATGRVRWTRAVNAAEAYFRINAVANNTLYIAEPETLRALDLTTGEIKWTTRVPFFSPFEPFTFVGNRVFVFTVNGDAMNATTSIFDAHTGRFLGEADSYGPLAAVGGQAFFQDSFFPLDYPDDVFVNVHDLGTGKRLERRTYSGTGRVTGNYSSSMMAMASGALYVSSDNNVACFPVAQRGGRAEPDFIRVPDGTVTWLEGPYLGTFVLGWRSAVWLVRARRDKPCAPVDLLRQGNRLGPGRVARVTISGNGLYVGLRNGAFYAADARSGQVGLRLELPAASFGPALVAGKTLIVQAGNQLLAFKLPELLSR